MQTITSDFLKNKVLTNTKCTNTNVCTLVEYFNKYCFTEQEVVYIFEALIKNKKKFHNVKNFLHYLKLEKVNFKYFNSRLKKLIKLKNNSMSLVSFLLRYGKSNAYKLFEERKKSVGKTKQQHEQKFGKEKTEDILKAKSSSSSLQKCIEKFGEIKGKEKWNNYLNKRAQTYKVNKSLGKYKGKYSLNWFTEKYGSSKGTELYKKHVEQLYSYSAHLQRNESNVANELFSSLHSKIVEEKVEVKKVLYKKVNKEYVVWLNEKQRAFVDFYVKLKNGNKKMIEFYGDYWHGNPEKYEDNFLIKKFSKTKTAKEVREEDLKREQLIRKKNNNLKIVWEKDFKKDKQKVINECFNFILED